MSLVYASYVTALAALVPIPPTDGNFLTMLPNAIDDAEQRLYRELDLINTIQRDSSAALSAGNRNFNLPASLSTFIVTEQINVVTPAGTSNPDSGTRNPVMPASREMLDALWPSATGSALPTYFAMVNQSSIILGPWPDQGYQVEVVGTFRPAPLSAANPNTLLTQYFPALFLAASMVFVAGWMKNYGAAVDDPQQGITWEQHYGKLLQSAQVEEVRKKFQSQGWSAKDPAPLATPPRT